MPIKILHLITDLDTGGAEISLYRLLAGTDRTQFDNQVVSLIPIGPVGEKIHALGIPVRSLDLQPGRPTLSALFRLAGLLHREKPAILQTWLYHADLLGLLAAKMTRTPAVVWNIRNSEMDLSKYRRLSGIVLRICAWLSGWPQAVISNSRAGRDFHARFGYHPIRWEIIPNGVDIQVFKPDPEARLWMRRELDLAPETILIGQVARFDPMKDQASFLRAAGQFIRSGSNAQFVMIGQDVTSENVALVEIIRQEELEGRVYLLGRREDTPRTNAALDILVSASSFGEGFPNVVAEAMASGVPCVVTDVGDSAHLVANTGIVVPPRNSQALAAAWVELLSLTASERFALGQRARQRIIQHFSLEKMVQAYARVHRDIIGTADA